MTNMHRIRSDFKYDLSTEQLEALLKLALALDEPIDQLIFAAIDEYIEREKTLCQPKP